MTEKDYKFKHIIHGSLNLRHKILILKNSKNALHYIARPIALKTKWTYDFELWFEIGQNPRFPEVSEKWII